MSIRQLPEIQAFARPEGMTWDAPAEALARWTRFAAVENDDPADISIFDVIGEDPWSGGGWTSRKMGGVLRNIGVRDITVSINSPGGDVFEGVAIYNLLRGHKAKVNVRVMGLAASAASLIAMAGDDITMGRGTMMMVHNAWAAAIGNRHDLRAAADVMERFDASMASIYSQAAGITDSDAAKLMDAETWMTGQEAIDAGFATSLLASDEVVADQNKANAALAAKRRVDSILAKQGMPRSERRALLEQMKGTHDAAHDVTHNADAELIAAMQGAIAALK